MKLRDSIKSFNRGVSKVITPEATCRIALKKLLAGAHPVMERYFKVEKPTGIPQYRVIASEYCQQITRAQGTNGKGHFDEQALASGLMELAERYSCFKYLRDKNTYKIATFKDFKNNPFKLRDFYANFINLSQVRILSDEELTGARMRWYRGYTLNGQNAYIPMYLLYFLLEGTNGMAAGNSLEEALLHGICEIIERHCLTRIELEKITTPLIDASTVNSPIASELIGRFKALKQKVFIKDFSLELGLPVIGVIVQVNKTDCFITAGVAACPEEALIRALTENSQCADKRWVFYQKIRRAKHHFRNDKVISMASIPSIENKNIKNELSSIQKILALRKMQVFFLEVTDKGLKIPSVFVYIAGAKYFPEGVAGRNILIGLVNEYSINKDYESALKYIQLGHSLDRENACHYHCYRGAILIQKKDYPGAISSFKKALIGLKIDEVKKITLYNIGLCYRAIKDMDRAIQYYVKAIDSFPDFSFEYFKLGEAEIAPQDDGGYRASYEEIKSYRASFPSASLKRIKYMVFKYQEDKKAIEAYLEKIKRCIRLKQYKKALAQGEKIIRLNPLAARVINLAKLLYACYEKTGNRSEAIKGLKKLEKIDRDNYVINFAISRCYREMGKVFQANQEFSRGVNKLSVKVGLPVGKWS